LEINQEYFRSFWGSASVEFDRFFYVGKMECWALAIYKVFKIALMILIAPHAIRHIGLTFLVPSVVDPALSSSFATAAKLTP